ncbi:sigma-Y antisigma factor component [Peribacillus alkalitolerans]|uniref:sigma-Y antisigma factor component n=1 Tax=Peribacillus alkalitolerans TaxID=1550385 RepID=UPI0013D4F29D|nr:sigma-Y antisigma factor component [Peribacillus alkalitolerans]
MTQAEWVILPFVIIILLAQSIFLFIDARKHGHNYWFWGIVGLIQAPMPILIYMLLIRKVYKKGQE